MISNIAFWKVLTIFAFAFRVQVVPEALAVVPGTADTDVPIHFNWTQHSAVMNVKLLLGPN